MYISLLKGDNQLLCHDSYLQNFLYNILIYMSILTGTEEIVLLRARDSFKATKKNWNFFLLSFILISNY